MEASVSEIHAQPLRPEGFEEPLFLGPGDKKAIAEHLAESAGWLRRVGRVPYDEFGRTAEVCHVVARPDGSAHLVRAKRSRCDPTGSACRRRRGTRGLLPAVTKRRVSRVLERWREVQAWWDPGCRTDRLCFRVLLSDGAVVDLALDRGEAGDRAGSWSLLRVLD